MEFILGAVLETSRGWVFLDGPSSFAEKRTDYFELTLSISSWIESPPIELWSEPLPEGRCSEIEFVFGVYLSMPFR
jgi:hypothetical protein